MTDASLGLFVKPFAAYQKGRPTATERDASRSTVTSSASSTILSPVSSHADSTAHQTVKKKQVGSSNTPSEADRSSILNDSPNGQPQLGEEMIKKSGLDDSTSITKSNAIPSDAGESVNSSTRETRTALSTAGAMAAASGKSLGNFFVSSSKGALVDLPLAAAEGLRVVPRMYGEELRDHGNITDWKSGFTVAGKTFWYGMYEGLTDIVTLPYKEKEKNGALGVATGFGKGIVSMATKTTSAAIGLVAYPADGISRSIRTSIMRGTRKCIEESKLAEGAWIVETEAGRTADQTAVLEAFDRAKKGKGRAT
jgi:hypothetical protein